MIPANDGIERQLKSLRPVNLVRIKGFLVEVSNKEGLHWKSSLTRSDTGAGACELLWVEVVGVMVSLPAAELLDIPMRLE